MTNTSLSNVVPLGYSERSAARRYGIALQTLRDLIFDDEVPAYAKDDQLRIPRGYDTGYDCQYNTNRAWADALHRA